MRAYAWDRLADDAGVPLPDEGLQLLRRARRSCTAAVALRKHIRTFSAFDEATDPSINLDQDLVRVDATLPAHLDLIEHLKALRPWRKGPFEICGTRVDGEWRSDWKWNRIAPLLPPLEGLRICDIGANNGYYLFRLRAHSPEHVIGIDPQPHYVATFEAVQRLARVDRIALEPIGVDDLPTFGPRFDLLLCMGLLYHHTDPIGVLRRLHFCVPKGGQLLVETIVIPGDDDLCVVPRTRYAGARGFYFLPTLPCLRTWVRRAGWNIVKESEVVKTTPDEQRTTPWREGPSLAEGLDPEDPEWTVEGYPAPWRVAMLLK